MMMLDKGESSLLEMVTLQGCARETLCLDICFSDHLQAILSASLQNTELCLLLSMKSLESFSQVTRW